MGVNSIIHCLSNNHFQHFHLMHLNATQNKAWKELMETWSERNNIILDRGDWCRKNVLYDLFKSVVIDETKFLGWNFLCTMFENSLSDW